MWSGRGMRGKKTTFGSGKTGMISGDLMPVLALRTPRLPHLESEAAHARPCANAVDPALHRAQGGLEFDPQPAEDHDARCKGRVGQGELLPHQELLARQPITKEVQT